MRIIQVVGRSNSGKTTFIKNLVPELKKKGTVAVIKHLGDHDFHLEEGKDTTGFFDAGADIAIGVDSNKSVIAIRNNTLETMLDLLVNQGIDFVAIEGFKQKTFPKIVIGSLTIGNCILRDPDIETVMRSLHQFADYPAKNTGNDTMASQKMDKKLFGTNGVRGVVGKDLTPNLVISIAEAFGTMRKGKIGVARDTRTSGESLMMAAKSGLLAMGCDVVDCGILPTPALQYLVKEHFDGGVMITASHNPPEYNGVKIIEPDGTEMGDEETIKLEQILFSRSFSPVSWDNVGVETYSPELIEEYITAIIHHFPQGIGSGMTVVVDPGSGPACITTPRILTGMGCKVLTVNGVMDGKFPGRMPEPSVEGLRTLAELVVSSGADFGVAHDGDADRAVFVNENGEFLEENREFALIARHICRKSRGVIVTPVSTGQIVELVAGIEKSEVIYTPVGSIYVARAMRSLIKEGNTVVFGGEGNGGLIFPEHQFCRDGGMTAAMMVALLAENRRKMSELADELPQRYIIKEKIRTQNGQNILTSLKRIYGQENVDNTDGLKIFRKMTWGLVRASGTEPIIRIIVDADEKKNGDSLYMELNDQVKKLDSSFT